MKPNRWLEARRKLQGVKLMGGAKMMRRMANHWRPQSPEEAPPTAEQEPLHLRSIRNRRYQRPRPDTREILAVPGSRRRRAPVGCPAPVGGRQMHLADAATAEREAARLARAAEADTAEDKMHPLLGAGGWGGGVARERRRADARGTPPQPPPMSRSSRFRRHFLDWQARPATVQSMS